MDITATSVTPVDGSGTVTLGGTAQTLFDANSARKGYWVQNNSAGDLWINEIGGDAEADQPSLKIVSGALYESPLTGCSIKAISIFGATTAQAFTAREW